MCKIRILEIRKFKYSKLFEKTIFFFLIEYFSIEYSLNNFRKLKILKYSVRKKIGSSVGQICCFGYSNNSDFLCSPIPFGYRSIPPLQFPGTFSRFFQLALLGMISACFGSFDGNELLLSAGGRVGNVSTCLFSRPFFVTN